MFQPHTEVRKYDVMTINNFRGKFTEFTLMRKVYALFELGVAMYICMVLSLRARKTPHVYFDELYEMLIFIKQYERKWHALTLGCEINLRVYYNSLNIYESLNFGGHARSVKFDLLLTTDFCYNIIQENGYKFINSFSNDCNTFGCNYHI